MKTYYHNITKKQLNESDIRDLYENYTEGDQIYKTESGDATLQEVSEVEIEEIKKRYADSEENSDDNE
jgi:hypothetical protein